MEWSVAVGVLGLAWLAAGLKTSRPDGVHLRVAPMRRMMLAIMPTRAESVVYYDAWVDAVPLERFLAKGRDSHGANMTHATVAAAGIALSATPRMNRFVSNGRLYQRIHRTLTFSMKRERGSREAQLSTVKLRFQDGETFPDWCGRVNAAISEERSGRPTRADREYALFNLLPGPLLRLGAWLFRALDQVGWLPGFFLDEDPLFTSIFVANLGSIGMGAGYHHLFEYGNCPLFITVGRTESRPVAARDGVELRPMLHLRFTYDERIEDGLNARYGIERIVKVLSEPERWLGDEAPMWPRPDLVAETGG
jgi:hypothetical protein